MSWLADECGATAVVRMAAVRDGALLRRHPLLIGPPAGVSRNLM